MIHNSAFIQNIGQALLKNKIDYDAFSKGQMLSKKWLIENLIEIDEDLGTVFICAGWYGLLGSLLLETDLNIEKIVSFDIDPQCADIADDFNRSWVTDNWKFKASTMDILKIEYPTKYDVKKYNGVIRTLEAMPDTIINTSCEHIHEFTEWYDRIPPQTLIVLQSNNYVEIEDHVNCSASLSDFSETAPMRMVMFEGEMELEKYTRFMKIGRK